MSAFKIVQNLPSVSVGAAASASSDAISLQSGYIRILPESDSYVEIGSPPAGVSTSTSLWIPGGSSVTLKENVSAGRVVGVTTGATTTIDFPEGQASPVSVGDYIELSGITPAGINTTFAEVTSVDVSSGPNGYYGTRAVINWDTSGQGPVTDINYDSEVRRAIKINVKDDSTGGKIHITEVQIASAV